MDITRSVSEGIKVWLCGGALLLALAWAWLPRRAARGLLVSLLVIATANYARFGFKLPFRQVDTYDLIHYYLNSKYFDELGYFDLYPACILADHEAGGPFFKEGSKFLDQDESGHHVAPISVALEEGQVVRAQKFTPERWEQFSHDFLFLQREVPGLNSELWRQLIQDHGFNGTPAWVLEALPFSAVPVEWIKTLGYLDCVWIALALAAVVWAWDLNTALWAMLFLMLTYSCRWPTISWAFFRYDYVSLLIIGMASLRKGRPLLAGFVTGWSATLRLFPAMWLYGPAMKGIFGLLQRKVHRPLLRLVLGFALGVGVWQGAATAVFGVDAVRTHFENMSDHNKSENLSSRRIGLALALPFRGDLLPKAITREEKRVVEDQKPIRFAIAGLVMVVLGWGLRNRRNDEAFAYGFLPFFLLTTASYYYYVARWTLWVLHAGGVCRPERGESRARHAVGLAMLAGAELFTNHAEVTYPDHRVYLIGGLAWILMGYSTVMTAWVVIESHTLGRFRNNTAGA
jgi:hypothetical protein